LCTSGSLITAINVVAPLGECKVRVKCIAKQQALQK
jgi:hypothetical protein